MPAIKFADRSIQFFVAIQYLNIVSAKISVIPADPPVGGRLRKRKKSYAKHRKETRDGQARYGRGSCLPIAQLPLTRNSVSVPAAINTAASPKPTTGETAVHTTPTEALEMNLAAPLTVPSAP